MSDGKNKGVQHKTSVGGQALIEGIMMRGAAGRGDVCPSAGRYD